MTNSYGLGGSTRSTPSQIGQLDWSRVDSPLRDFPNVAALIERGGRRSCRLGACPIFLEWLPYGTRGYLLRLSAIEADLDLLSKAHVPGLRRGPSGDLPSTGRLPPTSLFHGT